MTRSASRAASEVPSDAGSEVSTPAASETPSARVRRLEARNRTTLPVNESDAYGTKKRVRSSKLNFQATQNQAGRAMSSTIGQAGRGVGLEDVPEESSFNGIRTQNDLDNQLQDSSLQQLNNGRIGRLTHWLDNQTENEPVQGVFERPGLGPNESAGLHNWSFGQPITPMSEDGMTDQALPSFFERFKRMLVALILWPLTSGLKFVYYVALGLALVSLIDLYIIQHIGYDLDILKTRWNSRPAEPPCAPAFDDKPLTDRMDQIEALVKSLPLEAPLDLAQPRVDYFSPQNNAEIVPKLTSPQKKRKVRGWKSLFISETDFKQEQKVIGPFRDRKKMWCAPSSYGKAQITVSMAANMAPTEIVVRQDPHQMAALDPSSYPKEMELWVEVLDPNVREAIVNRVEEILPGVTFNLIRQYGRQLDEKQALPETFVPVARFEYAIRARRHPDGPAEQHFKIPIDISQYGGTSTRRAAVRINSNWGDAEAICVHEIRLHGRYMDLPRQLNVKNRNGLREVTGDFAIGE